jgi:multidrug transporter EmrE-like cation transporter
MNCLHLAAAIVMEVIATSARKAADGFTLLLPSARVVVCYCAALFLHSLTLRTFYPSSCRTEWGRFLTHGAKVRGLTLAVFG